MRGERRGWLAAGILWLSLLPPAPALAAGGFPAGERAYDRHDYERSARIFRFLAEDGDARAQTYLGVMYLRGEGVPQNFEAAADWLHRAAIADVPAAQYFLGLLYDKGQGVERDFVLAQAWLILAVSRAEPSWRSRWAPIRDAVASKMTRAQLEQAQRIALDWRSDHDSHRVSP